MAEKPEKRENRRFWIDLIAHVTAKSADDETFKENTVLRNISGGGASFVTRQADRYFQRQKLEIEIDLPGTGEIQASLKGTATVSRIERLPDSDPQQGRRQYEVAVVIAMPLQFLRKGAEMGA